MNLILDTETLDMNAQFVYDIAWAIVKRNKVVAVKNFITLEFIDRIASGSFSGCKYAVTMAEVKNGNAKILPWVEIMRELYQDFTNSNNVYAYNAQFDRQAIDRTSKALQCKSSDWTATAEFFDKWRDLWAWSTNTILYKKSFIDFCECNGFVTEKGNCKTSAEIAIRYMENNVNYVEQHTARADVLDEVKIYQWCKKAAKKEFSENVPKDDSFTGTWHNIVKLKNALNS